MNRTEETQVLSSRMSHAISLMEDILGGRVPTAGELDSLRDACNWVWQWTAREDRSRAAGNAPRGLLDT